MFVCVCLGVTDTEVRAAIDGGADSLAKVTGSCGAGGDCGACHAMIESMIAERSGERVAACRRVLPVVQEPEVWGLAS